MKKFLFTVLVAVLAFSGYGQKILIDNILNNNLSATATNNGLVWTNANGHLGLFDGYNYNLGIEVYAGPSSNNLTHVATLYPGDTNGTEFIAYDVGVFMRWPLDTTYDTGVAPGAVAWIELKMWWWEIGQYSTYLDALSNQVPVCDIVFRNPTGNPAASPPVENQTLTGMPAAILSIVCTSEGNLITQHPTNQVVAEGATATFSVAASTATGYQWLFNGDVLAGENTSTLVLTNVQLNNAGSYSVVVYGCPTVTSSNAILTVDCVPPSISQQPTNQNIAVGSAATFSVIADWAFGYQWRFNGTNISGATAPVFMLTNVQFTNAGAYSVTIYGCSNDVTSSDAILTVDCQSPTISQQPTNRSVAAGFNTTFSVTADWAYGYQWRFNGTNISGATGRTFSLTNLRLTNAGAYSVIIYGCSNNITSSDAILTVLTAPYPLAANQRGTVTCLETPSITYDIYLPSGYSTNGPPLPILYTMNPGGGGMVSDFLTVCSSMKIIVVGLTGSRNSWPWNQVLREMYAVPRDIRRRVLFDPTAQFVGGLSGGGENSYIFSRFWSQHIAGVLPMGGWLGRPNDPSLGTVPYFSTDRVQTNLLVARTAGNTDTGAFFYNPYDSNYLASCGAVVHDWIFSGGHQTAPTSIQQAALGWLLTNRIPAGVYDQSNSAVQELDWRSRISAGDTESVMRECVSNLMARPRTWFALRAQLVLDDLMTNYSTFQSMDVSNIYPADNAFITNSICTTNGPVVDYVNSVAINDFVGVNYWSQSDFLHDLFYYYAHGAATNADQARYYSALKIMTGIAGVNGDRAGDLKYVLNKFKYRGPQIQASPDSAGTQMNLYVSKNVPRLSYSIQSGTNLINPVWQNLSPSTVEIDTAWSAEIPFPLQPDSMYFRMVTTPLSGTSPPWPTDGGLGF